MGRLQSRSFLSLGEGYHCMLLKFLLALCFLNSGKAAYKGWDIYFPFFESFCFFLLVATQCHYLYLLIWKGGTFQIHTFLTNATKLKYFALGFLKSWASDLQKCPSAFSKVFLCLGPDYPESLSPSWAGGERGLTWVWTPSSSNPGLNTLDASWPH